MAPFFMELMALPGMLTPSLVHLPLHGSELREGLSGCTPMPQLSQLSLRATHGENANLTMCPRNKPSKIQDIICAPRGDQVLRAVGTLRINVV